nr:hypothetical protein [Paracoccus saliphilus]
MDHDLFFSSEVNEKFNKSCRSCQTCLFWQVALSKDQVPAFGEVLPCKWNRSEGRVAAVDYGAIKSLDPWRPRFIMPHRVLMRNMIFSMRCMTALPDDAVLLLCP